MSNALMHNCDKAWEEPMMELHFVPGCSPAMRALENVIDHIASLHDPILIVGEAAVGKHALAFRIHQLSRRLGESFRDLMASQVTPKSLEFPERKDAATRPGTLALLEVGDLSIAAQDRLAELYFSDHQRLPALPRLIATSARDLRQEVRQGRFRADLFSAISSVCLLIPALRFRKSDIPALADHYLQVYADAFGRRKPALTGSALAFLAAHDWPGNFDEFKTAMKMWTAVGDEHLALAALRAMATQNRSEDGEYRLRSLKQTSKAASRQAEKELILDVLSSTGWNRKRAAQQLQISYKALLYKLKQIHQEDSTVALESL